MNYYNVFTNNCVDVSIAAWNSAELRYSFSERWLPSKLASEIKEQYEYADTYDSFDIYERVLGVTL